MAEPKSHVFPLDDAARREIQTFGHAPGWRLIPGHEAPSFLPQKLRVRTVELLSVAVPTSTGGIAVMFNLRRPDLKPREIDQQPFLVVVDSTGCRTAGVFIDHGDWEGRSSSFQLPQSFVGEVTSSGIANYFRSQPPQASTRGPIGTLPPGDRAAFERITGIHGISAPLEQTDE